MFCMKKKIISLFIVLILAIQMILPIFATTVFANDDSNVNSIESKLYGIKPEDFSFDKDKKMILGIKKDILDQHEYIDLIIPDKIEDVDIESIDSLAFYNVKNIKKVNFDNANGLKTIGEYAFSFIELYKQTSVDFSKTKLENINKYAFYGTKLIEVKFNNETLKNIGYAAFGDSVGTKNEKDEDITKVAIDKLLENINKERVENKKEAVKYTDATKFIDLKDTEVYKQFEKEFKGTTWI